MTMKWLPALILSLAASSAAAGSAAADGAIQVPLPDISVLKQEDAETFASALALATVIGMNCPGFNMTDGEWTLLTDTEKLINQRFGLTTDHYPAAFKRLDEPGACDEDTPFARDMLYMLINLGGWPYEETQQ